MVRDAGDGLRGREPRGRIGEVDPGHGRRGEQIFAPSGRAHLLARAPSGGATLVPGVQAADLGQLDHLTGLGRHHRARRGRPC
jgi:hypothetical protein